MLQGILGFSHGVGQIEKKLYNCLGAPLFFGSQLLIFFEVAGAKEQGHSYPVRNVLDTQLWSRGMKELMDQVRHLNLKFLFYSVSTSLKSCGIQ